MKKMRERRKRPLQKKNFFCLVLFVYLHVHADTYKNELLLKDDNIVTRVVKLFIYKYLDNASIFKMLEPFKPRPLVWRTDFIVSNTLTHSRSRHPHPSPCDIGQSRPWITPPIYILSCLLLELLLAMTMNWSCDCIFLVGHTGHLHLGSHDIALRSERFLNYVLTLILLANLFLYLTHLIN